MALSLVFGATLTSSASSSVQVTPLPPVESTDWRAGVCYSFYPDPNTGIGRPFMPLAYDAGSRWDRFDFIWPNLQQENGDWTAEGREAYDDLVNDLRGAGFHIVGILLWTPDWATSGGAAGQTVPEMDRRPFGWYTPGDKANALGLEPALSTSASSPPAGLYQPWNDWVESDGDPINYWGRFVHQVVSRYGDRVTHWEMWNEPEWSYFWTGTSTDYARLLEVGYLATKNACADCRVLFGGLHYWDEPDYYKWVLNTLRDRPNAAENNYFFDIMSVHLYSRSSNAYEIVSEIRSGITARVPDHPIWLTETGVPVWDDGSADPWPDKYDYAATQREAASYLLQSYANAWASGVERYFFFRTHDADMTEYFGLVRNDMSLRPAYPALQVATTYLVAPSMVTNWDYSSGGVRRVTLWGTPHGKVSVLWNTTPNAVSFDYAATLPSATRVDQRGATQTINAAGGVYHIELPGATANLVSYPNDYFIGGEPYLIIEEDTVPPSQTAIDPLPPTTYSDVIRVSWGATDSQAGIWGFEVQARQGGTGEWADWLGILDTAGDTSADYGGGQHGLEYCFRARAWDRAGNPGAWSEPAECTELDMDRELHLMIDDVYGDGNSDGHWEADEEALTGVSFRLVDPSGAEVASEDSASSWDVTLDLMIGEYGLVIEPPDWPSPPGEGWLPRRLSVPVDGGAGPLEIHHDAIGLPPHRSSSYFPIVARGG
jgi:hypothetical protein